MACTTSQAIQLLVILINSLLMLASPAPQSSGLTQALCSTDNTGSSSAVGKSIDYEPLWKLVAKITNLAAFSDYMSNGRCFDTCKANYAFAIVQYQSCWCSNYAPAYTTSTGSCNENCPGYPYEQCGSQSGNLYGYIALSKSPSGTLGASSTSGSTTPTSAPPSSSQTVSFQFLSRSFSSFPLPSTQVSSFTTSVVPQVPSTSSSSIGSSTSIQRSSVISLIPSGPSSPPAPSPITVQETVTASPSVQISLVSIVCADPSSLN